HLVCSSTFTQSILQPPIPPYTHADTHTYTPLHLLSLFRPPSIYIYTHTHPEASILPPFTHPDTMSIYNSLSAQTCPHTNLSLPSHPTPVSKYIHTDRHTLPSLNTQMYSDHILYIHTCVSPSVSPSVPLHPTIVSHTHSHTHTSHISVSPFTHTHTHTHTH
ncbi:unnamed protein product, partial [Rangifer tarandus platyrhynchus]